MNQLRAEGSAQALFLRFAAPVLAAYLLHFGIWDLLLVAEQVVMPALTKMVVWVALDVFHNFSFIEEEMVPLRYQLPVIAYGFIQIILGLLVGWWVWRRRRKTPRQPLKAAQSN